MLDRALKRFRSRQAVYERERSEAVDLLPRLMEESPEHRELRLRNDPRFQTRGLLELVLEEGTREVQKAPAIGETSIRLALTLTDHLDETFYGHERINDLRARTWSVLGNARRLQHDLAGAEASFATAERHLREGTWDPMELAALSDLKASLLRTQGRLTEAMRLLKPALAVYTKAEARHQAGRVLLNMDRVHYAADRPQEGIPLLHQALGLLQEPALLLGVWHNLADNLLKLGRYMEARGAFARARPLYASYLGYPDRALIPKGFWIEGRIALGLGQFREAKDLLLQARDGLAAHGIERAVARINEDMRVAQAAQDQQRNRRQRRMAPDNDFRPS